MTMAGCRGDDGPPGSAAASRDIQAGKVDVIVCYKVDRLTRSLAHFAKIVEIFDAKGVSFVSVSHPRTQLRGYRVQPRDQRAGADPRR